MTIKNNIKSIEVNTSNLQRVLVDFLDENLVST